MVFRSVLAYACLLSAMLVCACTTATAQGTPPISAKTSANRRAAIEAAFARADTNADGRLSREEAEHLPEIAAHFDEFDTNKDGFLSREEFAAAATQS
jgi:Ca2+-binding EF-hand superfamily protein